MGETNLICPECDGEWPPKQPRSGFCCLACMNAGRIYYTGDFSLDHQPRPERQVHAREAIWPVQIKLQFKPTRQYGSAKRADVWCGDVEMNREGKTFTNFQGREIPAYSGYAYSDDRETRIDLGIVEPTVWAASRKVANRWIAGALNRAAP